MKEAETRGDPVGISKAYKESTCFDLLSGMCSVLLFKKDKELKHNGNSQLL